MTDLVILWEASLLKVLRNLSVSIVVDLLYSRLGSLRIARACEKDSFLSLPLL